MCVHETGVKSSTLDMVYHKSIPVQARCGMFFFSSTRRCWQGLHVETGMFIHVHACMLVIKIIRVYAGMVWVEKGLH